MTDTDFTAATCLVIGASGAIGSAVVDQFMHDPRFASVVAISSAARSVRTEGLTWIQTDHSERSIASIGEQLQAMHHNIVRVVICNGVLHGKDFKPEKMLEHIDAQSMAHVFSINVIVPALWLSALALVLKRSQAVVSVLSARVGSINDNRSGGWYSYRASKAALNMVLKTASIELARRAPGVKILAFHPGTTDSPLSSPFQRNVPAGKLFDPPFVALRLSHIMDDVDHDSTLSFLDWQGQPVPW